LDLLAAYAHIRDWDERHRMRALVRAVIAI
jgi:hypothetical protein